MQRLVLGQAGPAPEGLAAGAHRRLLPAVAEVVADQRAALPEGLPTRVALVGLRARVNPLAAHEVPLPVESLPAPLTFIEVMNGGSFSRPLRVTFVEKSPPRNSLLERPSADHHLPLNHHPQGSSSQDGPPCQHPSLASLDLSAFPRALVEPQLTPTWTPRKIPESGFPPAENCLALWSDILLCHLERSQYMKGDF